MKTTICSAGTGVQLIRGYPLSFAEFGAQRLMNRPNVVNELFLCCQALQADNVLHQGSFFTQHPQT